MTFLQFFDFHNYNEIRIYTCLNVSIKFICKSHHNVVKESQKRCNIIIIYASASYRIDLFWKKCHWILIPHAFRMQFWGYGMHMNQAWSRQIKYMRSFLLRYRGLSSKLWALKWNIWICLCIYRNVSWNEWQAFYYFSFLNKIYGSINDTGLKYSLVTVAFTVYTLFNPTEGKVDLQTNFANKNSQL